MGRNDKRKYQRNCAFSVKRKRTAWNKRKAKTMILDKQVNLAESDKGSFPAGTRRCNVRFWLHFGRDVDNVVTMLCLRRHYYDKKLTLLQRRVFDVGFPTRH